MSAGDKSQEENSTEGFEQVHAGVLSRVDAHVPKEVPFDVEPKELEGASMLGTEGQEF